MPPMKKGTLFGTALLTAAFSGLCITSLNSIIPVIGSIERTALESMDLHLEECVKQCRLVTLRMHLAIVKYPNRS